MNTDWLNPTVLPCKRSDCGKPQGICGHIDGGFLADYGPAVRRVNEYLQAEMDAASPAVVLAYCETEAGEVVELTLSDLLSVAHVAAWSLRLPGGDS